MSFTRVFIYFSILWLYLTVTDFDWNGVMESNAYCGVFSTRFSLSMNRVFSIQHHVFKHHYQKGYLHLTRTFFPRRSLHVISSMLITNLGREKNYQAKLFWTVIIDNFCTLYIVAVISKTKVGILTMWPFLKTKSLKAPWPHCYDMLEILCWIFFLFFIHLQTSTWIFVKNAAAILRLLTSP